MILALVAVFAAAGVAAPAFAAENDLYRVEGIAVDETADNAAVAREMALVEARKDAFETLLRRLLGEEDLALVETPADSTISGFLQDFEIRNESLSRVRYLATVDFRFDPSKVRRFLQSYGVRPVDFTSAPVLLLPYYQSGRDLMLWEDTNPWRNAWNSFTRKNTLVPVYVPLGDIADMQTAPADAMISGNYAPVAQLMQRYGADEAVLAVARLVEGSNDLRIMIYEYIGPTMQHTNSLTVHGGGSGVHAGIFAQGVKAVADYLQQRWKEQATTGAASDDMQVRLKVTFLNMSEWVDIQRRLEHVGGIAGTEVVSLNRTGAQLDVRFRGTESKLRLALAEQGLRLGAPVIAVTRGPEGYGMRNSGPPVYQLEMERRGNP